MAVNRSYKSPSRSAGLAPGELVHIGEQHSVVTGITIFDFNAGQYTETIIASVDDCAPFRDVPTVTWINIVGIHDVAVIENLCTAFGLHPLVIEDILNTSQRPKVEDYGDYLYIVLKTFQFDEATAELGAEQVSIILGHGFVISFEERKSAVLEPVRDRIRRDKGRVRKHGPDYLAYTLLDSIVDSYLVRLEELEEDMDLLENSITDGGAKDVIGPLHNLKQALIEMRKSVWPLRDSVGIVERSGGHLFQEGTRVYLRDLYDHTNLVIDTIETFRDTLSGLMDIHLTSMSIRTNEVMKILTIIATIFIPLTFLAGVYGMNFKYLPELEWHHGYATFWGICFSVTAVMLYYFRKNRWL